MFKKYISIVLLSALIANTGLAYAVEFSDVPSEHWAKKEINEVTDKKVIVEYTKDKFSPKMLVKREDFASMLVRALNQSNKPATFAGNYMDLHQAKDFTDINKLRSLNVMKGYPDNTFKPVNNITKAEVMLSLSNTLEDGYITTEEVNEVLSQFVDKNEISEWAKKNVAKAVKNDVYVKYPDKTILNGNNYATKAEVAYLLSKIMKAPDLFAMYKSVVKKVVKVAEVKPTVKNLISGIEHLNYTHASNGINEVKVSALKAKIVKGNVIETSFAQDFSTETNKVGDKIKLALDKDLYTKEGTFLFPKGTVFIGEVTKLVQPKLFNKNAKVGAEFNKALLPNGKSYDLSAGIATESGLIESGYTKRNFKKDATIFIVSSLACASVGALAGLDDESGAGSVIGVSTGAIIGSLGAAITRGFHIDFNQGDKLYIKFNKACELQRIQS